MAIRPFPRVVVADIPATALNRFRSWVAAYGVCRLSRSLKIDRRRIHTWTQIKDPIRPSLTTIRSIIALSHVEPLANGRHLRYEDFFGEVRIAGHSTCNAGRTEPRKKLTRRVL